MHAWLGAASGVLLVGLAAASWRRGFRRFRAQVRSALARTPDIAWVRDTPWGMVCRVWGYELGVDLLDAYQDACRRRADPAEVAAELARALRARVPAPTPPPLALVADRLLPLLRRQDRLPPADDYPPAVRLVRRRLDEEVAVIYVVEGLHQVTYVTAGMVGAWGIGPERLHELACANLRERTRRILDEIGGPRAQYIALDGYDAARMLVADLLAPGDADDLLVAVPCEHACLLAPSRDQDALARQAAELFARGPAPLTARLYRYGPAGPVPVT